MADTVKKYQIQQLQEDGSLLTLHPETEASIVKINSTDAGVTATNVQGAIKEIKATIEGLTGGNSSIVTGVKGSEETDYRTGQVEITKANIGLSDVVNTGDSATPVEGGTTKFTTGGAYTELAKKVDKTTKVNGHALSGDVTITKKDLGLENVNNVAITAEQVEQIQTNKDDIYANNQSIGTINGQIETINTNLTTVQETANTAKTLAEGRSRAVSFVDYAAMELALKQANKTDYRVGDNLFIEATETPDYWISKILDNNTGTYGYYEISSLETQKVDLSGYQKKNLTTNLTIDGVTKTTVEDALSALNTLSASNKNNLGSLDGNVKTNAANITKIVNGTTVVAKATHAVVADSATRATQDIEGNVIVDTYATKELVNATNAKVTTNTENITKITNGTTVVAKATHAVVADSATKATQDIEGNVIVATYLKKSGGDMSGDLDMGTNKIVFGDQDEVELSGDRTGKLFVNNNAVALASDLVPLAKTADVEANYAKKTDVAKTYVEKTYNHDEYIKSEINRTGTGVNSKTRISVSGETADSVAVGSTISIEAGKGITLSSEDNRTTLQNKSNVYFELGTINPTDETTTIGARFVDDGDGRIDIYNGSYKVIDTSMDIAATKFKSAKTISLTEDVTGLVSTDFSGQVTIATTLKKSGVVDGTYSAVSVNDKGIVTDGAQMLEVGAKTGTNAPSASLAIGGLFFKEI